MSELSFTASSLGEKSNNNLKAKGKELSSFSHLQIQQFLSIPFLKRQSFLNASSINEEEECKQTI